MTKLTVFEETWDSPDRPAEPEGMWAIPCPRCASLPYLTGHCGTCEHSEYGVKGWVLINAIGPLDACKIEDHTFEISFDAGGYHLKCLDPHPRNEQESMLRHSDFRLIPGCMEDGELRDMMAGSLKVKFKYVVEGGSYEYPNDVDVWYEITEAELVK